MIKECLLAFQSPQWGSNSKGKPTFAKELSTGFSPRNGEVILKAKCTMPEF